MQSNSKVDLKLLSDLSKKIGIIVKYLSVEEREDLGLLKAIQIGRTKEYIDTNEFLKELKNESIN